MKTAVVTDSTAFLSNDIKNHPDLFIIPIPVIIDGKIYNEGIDIASDDYYDVLNHSQQFPTTSQPSIGEILETYRDIAKEGYDTVISIHMSSGISGFVRNLAAVAPGVEGVKIYPFDSKITSMPMGYMVEKSLEMAGNNQTPEEILEKLTEIREGTEAFMIVDDLNNLVRGGRLKNGAALIGTLLKIKPILTFNDGQIILSEKIRSSKKAFARAEDLMAKQYKKTKQPMKYFIIHANHQAFAELEVTTMKEKCPNIEIQVGSFGPVIGTHLGEKAIGFAWCPK